MTRTLGPRSGGPDSGSLGHSLSSWVGVHYTAFVEATFLSFVILNIIDMWTSAVALGRGLDEGNSIVVSISNTLGLQVFGGLALVKVVALFGGLAASIMAIHMKDQATRKAAIAVMMLMTLFMLVASVNNLVILGI